MALAAAVSMPRMRACATRAADEHRVRRARQRHVARVDGAAGQVDVPVVLGNALTHERHRGSLPAPSSTNATTRAKPALARLTLIGKQLTLKPCGRGIAPRLVSFSIWQ